MKRFFRILAAVLLAVTVLTGCTGLLEDKTITCNELSVTLPGIYVDLSEQDYAADFDFLYGFNDEAVLGFKQDRASLEASMPGITAKDYAELFVDAAELNSTVTEQEGLITFTYTAIADNVEFTYLCGAFMSDTNFWIVQFYCPTEDYTDKEADFLGYLKTVQV